STDSFPAANAAVVTGRRASRCARRTSVLAVAVDREHSRASRAHPALEPADAHTRRRSHCPTWAARSDANRAVACCPNTTFQLVQRLVQHAHELSYNAVVNNGGEPSNPAHEVHPHYRAHVRSTTRNGG